MRREHRPRRERILRAECYAGDTAMWAATEAVVIHGGNGYTTDYAAERPFRDAKITRSARERTRSSASSSQARFSRAS